MPNSIAFAKTYAGILDEVYKRASVSGVLNSGRRMARAGRNAKEIMVPKISVTGLGGVACGRARAFVSRGRIPCVRGLARACAPWSRGRARRWRTR